MLIPFEIPMPLEDFLACRGRVEMAPPPQCPACGDSRVTFAGWWARLTRLGPVDIHRVACAGCETTHSLWPDVLVAGCGDLADTVGAALQHAAHGAGHRVVAARTGLAATTVRGWLRRFRRRANDIATRLFAVAASAGGSSVTSGPRSSPLTTAVAAVGAATSALAGLSGEPVAPWPFAVRILGGRLLG